MEKTKDVKLPKLDAICSTNDFKKPLQHIQFIDGFAVATDGYIFVRWKHKSIQDITIDPHWGEKGLLHYTQFKCLRKLPGPYQITKDGVTAYGGKVLFPFVEDVEYPVWDSVYDFKEAPYERRTVVNLKCYAKIQDAFGQYFEPGFGAVLCERKSCHLLYPYHGNDFMAIIMKMSHLFPDYDPEAMYNP